MNGFYRSLMIFSDKTHCMRLFPPATATRCGAGLGVEPGGMVQRSSAGHAGGHAGRADRRLFQLCRRTGHKRRPRFERTGAARAGCSVSRTAGKVLAGQTGIGKRRVSNASVSLSALASSNACAVAVRILISASVNSSSRMPNCIRSVDLPVASWP